MKEVSNGRNLLDQPYPKEPARRAFHRPRHRRHSSRKRLGRKPIKSHMSALCWTSFFVSSACFFVVFVGPRRHVVRTARSWKPALSKGGVIGKESYLWEGSLGEDAAEMSARHHHYHGPASHERMTMEEEGYLHQQTGLTAGTISYNNKLSTDFRHLD